MDLTGKAKAHFEKYIEELEVAPYVVMLDNIPKCYLNALILDWLDSVNIFVDIKSKFGQRKQCRRFSFCVKDTNSGFMYNSRPEATKEAIIKCNEIYNS